MFVICLLCLLCGFGYWMYGLIVLFRLVLFAVDICCVFVALALLFEVLWCLRWITYFALAWWICFGLVVVCFLWCWDCCRLFGLLFCASSFAVLVVALIGCWLGWLCLLYMMLMCGTGICLFVGFMILVGGFGL